MNHEVHEGSEEYQKQLRITLISYVTGASGIGYNVRDRGIRPNFSDFVLYGTITFLQEAPNG